MSRHARVLTAYYLYPLPTYYLRLTTCDVLSTCRSSDLPYCYLPYCYLPYYYLPYCYLPSYRLPYYYLPYCYLPYWYLPYCSSPTASRWRPCWLRRSSS